MKRRKLLKGILFGSSGLVLSTSTINLLTSCETFEDIGAEHCGNCWWCKERE
mgnify:CR=1 FL=1